MNIKIKIILAIFSLTFVFYVWLIEPQWIEINHYNIKIPFDEEVTILQISDLHTKGYGLVEKKVINAIATIEPDVIVLTGDISSPGTSRNEYREVLSKIIAPKGVYFVNGNWEYWNKIENFNEILNEFQLKKLDNSNKQLTENIWLLGFDDALEGSPDEKSAFLNVPINAYKIGIFHSPVYFDSIFKKINLALSGHTHGGQMKLPFINPFWLPMGGQKYVSGWFKKEASSLYVSRGIGTSILPFRLFARPEIAVFHIGKNDE
jgi:predicted MPP superfamily phosphohydrolase